MSNPKVFEFAKEVGMTPLALMDKIREWHLPVKSHMAELDAELVAMIRNKLSETSKGAESDKKVTARKKTKPKAAEAETPKTSKSASASTSPTAKHAKSTAKPKITAKEEDTIVKASSSTVVRRKKTEVETTPSEEIVTEVIEQALPVIHSEAKIESSEVLVVAPSVAPAPVEEVSKKPSVARKKEVAIGASGVASEQTTTPKRNIIGRMDLSRVQQPPSGGRTPYSSSGPRPSGAPQSNMGARPKGNIRAGFFQAPMDEIGVVPQEEPDRKKDDKRSMKGGAVSVEGPTRELEAQPPAFDASEFRKREMVFQPKKKKGLLARPAMQTQITKPSARKRIVRVYGVMKVADLAQAMGIKAPELIKALLKNGVTGAINTELDYETIALIVSEFGFEAQNVQKTAQTVIDETAFGDLDAEPVLRPPVVAVMGHVDHGKTSLLDAIRSAKVAAGEAGGITQHIGAYQVTLDDKSKITFLDTPGHEAFTSMRARGANVTDIAIIVVAAEDGVMPQTAEAINHAKAAKVPMIVVINKIDKPGANPDRIKQQLTEYEVVPEEWGGSTIFCNVSALKHTGIKELLEQIKVLAEVMELKANPKRSGTGTVIEARLEKGRGSVATILVQNGTVKVGQYIVAGAVPGRIRSLMNDRGERVNEGGPGSPVEVLGLDAVPQAGDKFDIVKDEKSADEISKIRKDQIEAAKVSDKKLSLEDIFAKVQMGDVKELAVVLKADVAGSLEAIQGMFQKLSTPEVKVRVIHAAIGGITETDVMLASTAKGIIIGFGVRPDSGAQNAAKRYGIDVRTYSVVYELIDEMKKAMTGLLTPDIVEKVMGRAEVRNTFTVPKIGAIAGCMVADGKIMRTNMARLLRDGKIIYEGKIASLKRFKDDAREVAQGFECGIGIENFNDIKVGDIIEAFTKEEVARELSAPSAEA